MKVLVIGGGGFIGSHVVDALLSDGHRVRVLSRSCERFRPTPAGVDYRIGNFLDPQTVMEAIAGVDAVFHIASTTVPITADCDPRGDVRENLLGTMSVIEVMLSLGVRRLLFLSSGGTVYGIPDSVPLSECHPLRPISSYGIVKSAIESFIRLYQRTQGLSAVVIRASNPVGPRQGHAGVQGVVSTFLSRIATGEPVEIWGDGTIIRDYIDVRDLADLCVRAGTSQVQGIYNAGSGQGTSLNELLDIIRQVTRSAVTPIYKAGRRTDVPVSILDPRQAEVDFGWQRKFTLRDSVASTWRWQNGGEE